MLYFLLRRENAKKLQLSKATIRSAFEKSRIREFTQYAIFAANEYAYFTMERAMVSARRANETRALRINNKQHAVHRKNSVTFSYCYCLHAVILLSLARRKQSEQKSTRVFVVVKCVAL